MSPGDPKGQQAARHLRRGRASFSASQVRLPVQRQPVRIPVFVQRQHHPVPGETLCPLSLFLLHFAFQTSPPSLLVLQAPSSVRDPSRVVLNDGSCWTIIGVEAVEFTFNQGLACIQTPVTPFPLITGLEVSPRSTQEPEPPSNTWSLSSLGEETSCVCLRVRRLCSHLFSSDLWFMHYFKPSLLKQRSKVFQSTFSLKKRIK